MAWVMLHLATRGCQAEVMQPLHGPKNGVYYLQGLGIKAEALGASGEGKASEEGLGGGGVRCRVRREWDWGLETRSLLCFGGDQGAPKGAEWVPEEDHPKFRWVFGSW